MKYIFIQEISLIHTGNEWDDLSVLEGYAFWQVALTQTLQPQGTDNCTLLSWGMMLLIVLNHIPRSVAVRHSEHQKGRRALLCVQWKSSARNLIHSWLVFDGCKIMSSGSFSFCLCDHLPHSALPKHNQQLHISLKITMKNLDGFFVIHYTGKKYVMTIDFRNLKICLEKLHKCMFIEA